MDKLLRTSDLNLINSKPDLMNVPAYSNSAMKMRHSSFDQMSTSKQMLKSRMSQDGKSDSKSKQNLDLINELFLEQKQRVRSSDSR